MKFFTFGFFMLLVSSVLLFATNETTSHQIQMNIQEEAIISLNNTDVVTLTTVDPAQGGMLPTGTTDSSKKLHYTSIVAAGTSRNITVQMGSSDTAPSGTELKLEAIYVPSGSGISAPQVTVTDTPHAIITNIGSCATGIGTDGAQLQYELSVVDTSALVVGDSSTVTITFTLSDAG